MSTIIEKIKGWFPVSAFAEEKAEKIAEINLATQKTELEIEKIKAETELLKTQNEIKKLELAAKRAQIQNLK